MKSSEQIQSRIRKIRSGYLKKLILNSQSRHHHNCLYNKEESINNDRKTESEIKKISPKSQVTLIVFQEEKPVRYCTYNDHSWNGIICDDDNISKNCKYFISRNPTSEVEKNFELSLEDDSYVLKNYKDLAALQWVLEERSYNLKYKFFENILLQTYKWFVSIRSFLSSARIRLLRLRSPIDDN